MYNTIQKISCICILRYTNDAHVTDDTVHSKSCTATYIIHPGVKTLAIPATGNVRLNETACEHSHRIVTNCGTLQSWRSSSALCYVWLHPQAAFTEASLRSDEPLRHCWLCSITMDTLLQQHPELQLTFSQQKIDIGWIEGIQAQAQTHTPPPFIMYTRPVNSSTLVTKNKCLHNK